MQLQDWTRPKGCRKLRMPESLDSRHMKVDKVVSLKHLPLHSRTHHWYSFLLEAELNSRPYFGRND